MQQLYVNICRRYTTLTGDLALPPIIYLFGDVYRCSDTISVYIFCTCTQLCVVVRIRIQIIGGTDERYAVATNYINIQYIYVVVAYACMQIIGDTDEWYGVATNYLLFLSCLQMYIVYTHWVHLYRRIENYVCVCMQSKIPTGDAMLQPFMNII